MKEDMEVCCDSLALSYTEDEEVREYGFTILNIIDYCDLFVKELNFTEDGKVPKTVFTWTKDHILNSADKTDSSYEIKDIDGATYMFFQ